MEPTIKFINIIIKPGGSIIDFDSSFKGIIKTLIIDIQVIKFIIIVVIMFRVVTRVLTKVIIIKLVAIVIIIELQVELDIRNLIAYWKLAPKIED